LEDTNILNPLRLKKIVEDKKENLKIIHEHNSAELPSLQISIIEETPEGHIMRNVTLVSKAYKYKDAKNGMEYLISKRQSIMKNKKYKKYKDISIG
jgi:hypothetical protein